VGRGHQHKLEVMGWIVRSLRGGACLRLDIRAAFSRRCV